MQTIALTLEKADVACAILLRQYGAARLRTRTLYGSKVNGCVPFLSPLRRPFWTTSLTYLSELPQIVPETGNTQRLHHACRRLAAAHT